MNRLKAIQPHRFIQRAFRDIKLKTAGQTITKILPGMSRLSKNKRYSLTKQRVLNRLDAFLSGFSD